MIEAHGVALGYGGRTFVRGVSLDVRAGEVLALVGPNGAGKTSLLRAFAGLLAPAEGSIVVDGIAIDRLSARERGRRIAVVEAEGVPPEGLSVREVVENGRLPYRAWWQWSAGAGDGAIVDDALERTALQAFAGRPFAELSSGERQRAWIAVALAQRAATILLDEPTSHLDIRHAFEALELMRTLAVQDARAAAVVLHDLNLAAAFADRVAVLGEGALLAYGTPREALRADVLSRAYGVAIDVREDAGGLIVIPRRQRSA